MKEYKITGFADEISPSFPSQIASLKKLNLKFIEIRNIDRESITKMTIKEVKAIKKQLDDNNIKVSSLASPIGKIFITENNDAHFALFQHALEIAQELETNYIRLFSYYIPNGDYDKYHDEVIKRLSSMVELAERNKVVLLHENEKDIYGDAPERCLKLLTTFSSPYFRAIFDFANFVQCGYNPLAAYPILKDFVEYFHIKDARFRDKEVVPPGLGDGNLANIIKHAVATGYENFFSLEPHLGNFIGRNKLELATNSTETSEESDGFLNFQLALNHFKMILADL